MKKIITVIFLLVGMVGIGYAQDLKSRFDSSNKRWHESHDSILQNINTVREDTTRVLLLSELANYYKFDLPDSALFYGYKGWSLARQIKFPRGEIKAISSVVLALNTLGNNSKALQINLQGLKIAEKDNLVTDKALLLDILGVVHYGFGNYTRALGFHRQAKVLFDSLRNFTFSALEEHYMGENYLMLDKLDSASYFSQKAYENAIQLEVNWVTCWALITLGRIQVQRGNPELAIAYFRQSLSISGDVENAFRACFFIAQTYQQINKRDSCIYYADRSLELVRGLSFFSNIIKANTLLSAVYEKSDPQKALQYSKVAISYKDSLDKLSKETSMEYFTTFDEEMRQYEIETANTAYRNRFKQYLLMAGLLVFLLIAFILYRNNRHKQKSYTLLQKQKQEIDFQKAKVEQTLSDLKSTQSQLIQSEKMASLGELTAGIAHEIQNPLNFVNNFSEVNTELIDELKSQKSKVKSERDENLEDELLNDIAQNLEKIAHHGKRADAIVKGMLQHSRTSSGVKEPTDISALADEYLRLAYHGLRAKDKTFNATIQTDFERSLPKINIIPQDMGRVLLNLYNNAFYAVNEKKKQIGDSYKPIVSVSTKKIGDKVQVGVKDNGNGIPQKALDKIFQPFFTTKPTGQGTGLGLSLAYDIVKAHGGEIKVESKENEGVEFIIQLPYT